MGIPMQSVTAFSLMLAMLAHAILGCCSHHAHAAAESGIAIDHASHNGAHKGRECPNGPNDDHSQPESVINAVASIASPESTCGGDGHEHDSGCNEDVCRFVLASVTSVVKAVGPAFDGAVAIIDDVRIGSLHHNRLEYAAGGAYLCCPPSLRPQQWVSVWLL